MEKKSIILNKMAETQPSANLKRVIMGRIFLEKEKARLRKILFFRLGFFLSAIVLVASGFLLGREIIISDFWVIASLGLTDMRYVMHYWQEFGWSLVETFPSMEIAGILVPFLLILFLTKNYYQEESILKLNYR